VRSLSVTEAGRALGRRLPFEADHGRPAEALARHWDQVDGLVLIMATGAAVRLVAPHLVPGEDGPAVVTLDDAGRHAVALLGGHRAGANDLARQVAALVGAEPVVTTATDARGRPALDALPGLRAEGDLAAVTTALLDDRPVGLVNEPGWPLPPALTGALDPGATGAPVVVVSDRLDPARPPGPAVLLRPPSLVAGVGCSTGAGADEARAALDEALARAGLARASLSALATIDRRADHPATTGLAGALGLALRSFSPEALAAVDVPHPSAVVHEAVGTPSVAEAAALLAAGPGGELVLPKQAGARVTVALARRSGPAGSLSVVGLGPGHAAHRTPAAEAAVRAAEAVLGYGAYLDQAADLLGPGQEVLSFPLGAELERCAQALRRAAAGQRVALVCSGDPGIYAMASPLCELAGDPDFGAVEITVVPGVTAGLAAAAELGAPLGHDHLVVSLSDLRTPWERIEAVVEAAARADLPLVIYNPRSVRRSWQLEKARGILLAERPPDTPVGLVTDVARPGGTVVLTTLGDLDPTVVTMTTCVVIGSRTTRLVAGRMVTPRGYDR
jgi:cobalt-precorrin 5A hydrolase/precorrin-3B C17-methyltransferase